MFASKEVEGIRGVSLGHAVCFLYPVQLKILEMVELHSDHSVGYFFEGRAGVELFPNPVFDILSCKVGHSTSRQCPAGGIIGKKHEEMHSTTLDCFTPQEAEQR